jgi:hypothetical protein
MKQIAPALYTGFSWLLRGYMLLRKVGWLSTVYTFYDPEGKTPHNHRYVNQKFYFIFFSHFATNHKWGNGRTLQCNDKDTGLAGGDSIPSRGKGIFFGIVYCV